MDLNLYILFETFTNILISGFKLYLFHWLLDIFECKGLFKRTRKKTIKPFINKLFYAKL